MQPVFYLLLGYPGSGKTTASKLIHELTGAVHLWADHERRQRFETPKHTKEEHLALYSELNKQARELLSEGKSVVYDTNFNFYKDRQHMREIAQANNARVELIWVQTPLEVAKQRATQNAHLQGTRVLGDMSEETFERMANHLERPQSDEACIELDGTKLTADYITKKLHLGEWVDEKKQRKALLLAY